MCSEPGAWKSQSLSSKCIQHLGLLPTRTCSSSRSITKSPIVTVGPEGPLGWNSCDVAGNMVVSKRARPSLSCMHSGSGVQVHITSSCHASKLLPLLWCITPLYRHIHSMACWSLGCLPLPSDLLICTGTYITVRAGG